MGVLANLIISTFLLYFYRCRYCYFITLLFISSSLFAQEYIVEVGGSVQKNGSKLSDAILTLYKGSTELKQWITKADGEFGFQLKKNQEYNITVTKAGHIQKKYTVSTKGISNEREKKGFNPFLFTVNIFETQKNIDYSILNEPIAKIVYDPTIDDFNFDKAYTSSMLDALAKLKAIEENTKKQLKATTDSIYYDLIHKADNAFINKDYPMAITLFNSASKVEETKTYPKEKIAEIELILRNLKKSVDSEEKYKFIISKADQYFENKDYSLAKASYKDALIARPDDVYAKEQIEKINGIYASTITKKELEKSITGQKTEIKTYTEGITEEQYDEGNCRVTKRVVVKEGGTNVYLKKVWTWGATYYFKNNNSISEVIFEAETK